MHGASTRVRRLGFESTNLVFHPAHGPPTIQLTTKCGLQDGHQPVRSHSYTCNMDSILIFADSSWLNAVGPGTQSDPNITHFRTWLASQVDPGLGAVFAGITAHSQEVLGASTPTPAGYPFLFTRADCEANLNPPSSFFHPPTVDYLYRTMMGDSATPSWDFSGSVSCMNVEVF